MKAIKTFDLNAVCEELENIEVQLSKINKCLILDGAYGYQCSEEGILNNVGITEPTNSEFDACRAGIEAALQSVNQVMKNLDIEFEIVEVDLVDYIGWMMIVKGQTPKMVAKQIKKQFGK
jgi:hypothetical protein